MTRRRLGLSVGAIVLVLWCGWPTVASADDCLTRAAHIAAGEVPASEVDPDCRKAGILGAAATVTIAGAVVGIGAVSLGLGLWGAGVGASSGGAAGGLGLPGDGPGVGGMGSGTVPAGPSTEGGSTGVGSASRTGSTAGGTGRVPAPPGNGPPTDSTSQQSGGAGERDHRAPSRPGTRSEPPRAKGVGRPTSAPPPLRGQAGFAALERAGLAERVPGQQGVYRLRPGVEALGQPDASATGVSGIAYFLRVDGTLDPNIAVGMVEGGPSSLGSAEAAGSPSVSESTSQAPVSRTPEPASEAEPSRTGEAPAPKSDTSATEKTEAPAAEHTSVEASATPGAEGAGGPAGEVTSELVEEKLRHVVLEIFSPGKLVGGRFHDIEHFREQYQEAKAIENPWEAQQAQDYVVYLFVKEIGVSEPAARTLLELPKAKWEPLATLIASVAH